MMDDELEQMCLNCGKGGLITPQNSLVVYYDRSPIYSYLDYTCPSCNKDSTAFFREEYKEWIDALQDLGCVIVKEGMPPPEIVKGYNKTFKIKKLIPHQLSVHDRNLVEFFHYELERCDIETELA